jgi:hypothetical protein
MEVLPRHTFFPSFRLTFRFTMVLLFSKFVVLAILSCSFGLGAAAPSPSPMQHHRDLNLLGGRPKTRSVKHNSGAETYRPRRDSDFPELSSYHRGHGQPSSNYQDPPGSGFQRGQEQSFGSHINQQTNAFQGGYGGELDLSAVSERVCKAGGPSFGTVSSNIIR